jgi:hypothetical protein
MSVKLRKRDNKDGTTSLLLDIYHNGKRSYEFLKHLQLPKATGPADRQTRKEFLEQAKKIAVSRAAELQANDYDLTLTRAGKVLVLEWMEKYAKDYRKADVRVVDGVVGRFSSFLKGRNLT